MPLPKLILSKRTSAIAIGVFAAACFAWFFWQWRAGESGVASLMVDGKGKSPNLDTLNMLIRQEGITAPEIVSAAEGGLEDSAEVIGVQVGEKFRAYRIASLATGPTSHIVNDVVDDIPVTVTYCNMADCARVYSGPERGRPLKIGQGGLHRAKRMLLRIGDSDLRWFQDDGKPFPPGQHHLKFPFGSYPFVRSTWKKWKTAHPTTEVYAGRVQENTDRPRQDPG